MTRARGTASLIAIVLLAPLLAGCTDLLGSNSPPTATISVDPSGTVRAESPVTFSAAGSSDPDGDSMTFEWDFGDGNTGNGLTTSHTYAQPGDYTVELAVGDGTHETTTSTLVTVVDASAREPHAEITTNKDNDCEDDDPPNGDFVIVWVCEDDKEIGDREVVVSTTVTLDGSESWAGCDPEDSSCYSEEYLVEWKWDLDTYTDSDGDGVTDNDVDATGETYNWEERPAGAWEVRLTVVDNNGLEDHSDSMVYVNYRGVWKDFEMDRRIQEPIIMTWEFPLTYDEDSKDRIRYARAKLAYPKEDDDQIGGGIGGTTTNNKLDLYMYNSTDEEVANTTGIENDNRDAGECDSEDYCVWMVIGGSTVRGFQPGQWTIDLENAETHTTKVNHLIIELQYR
ncbi:MAG: PKD domain-containing protein [Candidatus Thalassarchaeaceae archaeon]|nr:PKD domain-containing protein [Candidatus Thalassarchaeaceae archaeon]